MIKLSEAMELTLEDLICKFSKNDRLIDILSPPPKGKYWTKSEEDEISKFKDDSEMLTVIANKIGRPRNSVDIRLRALFPKPPKEPKKKFEKEIEEPLDWNRLSKGIYDE